MLIVYRFVGEKGMFGEGVVEGCGDDLGLGYKCIRVVYRTVNEGRG